MKKLLLAFAAIVISASVIAQNATTFSIAGNVGSGTATNFKLSAGADIQADFPATTGLKITGSVGYQNFNYKFGSFETNYAYIPILAGAKVPFGGGFYGHGQLGYAVGATSGLDGEFAFAPSLGYGFGKNFDLAVKYLSIDKVNAILARLAYNF